MVHTISGVYYDSVEYTGKSNTVVEDVEQQPEYIHNDCNGSRKQSCGIVTAGYWVGGGKIHRIIKRLHLW